MYTFASGNDEIGVYFTVGWDIFMTGAKLNILLVAPFINGAETAVYWKYVYTTAYFTDFVTDLGVNTSLYHPPETG